MPVITAIIEGKNVQVYDSLEIMGDFDRGCWRDTDDWGLLKPLDYYRIKNDDGTYEYFNGATMFSNRKHFDDKQFS